MTEPRVIARPLGAARLSAEAIGGRLPADWLPVVPRSAASWRAHLSAVQVGGGEWRTLLAPAFSADAAAAARLDRSANGRGVVVTTGQQPGLFGGPIYTWSKALSALALANELERLTGVPAAPVFWAATNDSDYAEAAATCVARDGDVERLVARGAHAPGQRLRDTPLGDVSALITALERAAGAAVDRAALDAVRESYAAGATMGSAFVALLARVLGPLGIAVLDAGHPAVIAAAERVVRSALAAAPAVDAALRTREAELRAGGFEPKVPHVTGLSLVFGMRDGRRRRIPIAESRGAASGPLEANVLLRPVVERAILPAAAYLGGPGELAYFAQVSAVAVALGEAMPLALPRWAGLIVEPHVIRTLERHALSVDDLRDPHAADTRLARRRMPDAVEAALSHYRAALDNAHRALASAVDTGAAPLVPEAVLEGARRGMAHRLDRLERRLVAAVKRQERGLMRDLAVARASLFPLGQPQERLLNFIPFLARHGTPLLTRMSAAAADHAAALVGDRAPAAARSSATTA